MDQSNGTRPRDRRGGRPTKLTKDVRRRILRAIRAGSYLEPACVAAGVGYSTYREWVRRFPKFRAAVERAQAVAEVRLVGLWRDAAVKDWKAAKELLARRHPDRWSTEARVTVAHEEDELEPLIQSREDAHAAMRLLIIKQRERMERERQERERRAAGWDAPAGESRPDHENGAG